MILKIKELGNKAIILSIKNGRYYINIQNHKTGSINRKYLTCSEEEILETYDSMDYSVKEVVSKLDEVYEALAWDFKG